MKKMFGQIGIPFSEVSDRLTALDESLKKHDMALKSDTGVQMELIHGQEPYVIGFTLQVVVFNTKQEEGDGKKEIID